MTGEERSGESPLGKFTDDCRSFVDRDDALIGHTNLSMQGRLVELVSFASESLGIGGFAACKPSGRAVSWRPQANFIHLLRPNPASRSVTGELSVISVAGGNLTCFGGV